MHAHRAERDDVTGLQRGQLVGVQVVALGEHVVRRAVVVGALEPAQVIEQALLHPIEAHRITSSEAPGEKAS